MNAVVKSFLIKWGDDLIFLGQIILAMTNIPVILDAVQLPYITTIPCALVMGLFALVFWSLGLKRSMGSSLLAGTMWTILIFR